MNAGRFPPIVTDPIFSGLGFTRERMIQENTKTKLSLCFPLFDVPNWSLSEKINNGKWRIQSEKKK
jgi:hypothetical protein